MYIVERLCYCQQQAEQPAWIYSDINPFYKLSKPEKSAQYIFYQTWLSFLTIITKINMYLYSFWSPADVMQCRICCSDQISAYLKILYLG